MSHTRIEVYEQMQRDGNYGDASDYRDTCERHGHSMHERVDRFSVEDGAAFSHVGDEAKRALENIQSEERRAEERRQEEQEQERREEHNRQLRYQQRLECEQEDNLNEE